MTIIKQTSRVLISTFFLVAVFLFMTAKVNAQSIELDLDTWDFGDLELGNSDTRNFRITSTIEIPLTVDRISFTSDSSSSFFIDELLLNGLTPISSVPPGQFLRQGEFLDLLVRFTSDSLGLHTGEIRISSNAEPPNQSLFIQLSGNSVSSQPIPEPTIFVLMGLGFAGIGYVRKKKQS